MQSFLLLFSQPIIPVIITAICLVLFMIVLVQGIQISRLKKRMKRFFTGSDGRNIEEQLGKLFDHIEDCRNKQDDQQFTLNRLSQRLSQSAGNLAVIRYNAFGDVGSDLSFSLALIDEHQNGVVLTSIYGREESRTYAKPIEGGKSMYNLSEEELAVLKKASQMGKA